MPYSQRVRLQNHGISRVQSIDRRGGLQVTQLLDLGNPKGSPPKTAQETLTFRECH